MSRHIARTRNVAVIALLLTAGSLFAPAHATEASDCLFDCQPARVAASEQTDALLFCKPQALDQLEAASAKVKQVKDWVNLIQSPAGLALKLVNDHVVHIPDWVGYVADPKGAVKNKVMSLARREVKKAVGLDRPCITAVPDDATLPEPESVDSSVHAQADA